ncbi:MAG TPA: class I SAM-dependent methyltransferase [Actinomycetota bacterium]|nr:class I SAM-dependent methyltransferase [Actinomycetota bacterium]
MSSGFDPYSASYRETVQRSISFSGRDVDFFSELKARHLVATAARTVGKPSRLDVLDVGCGVGITDGHLRGAFRSLSGVDVSEGMLREARRMNPENRYDSYDGASLPHPANSFDVAFAISVLHHVPMGERDAFCTEMARIVRPGGIVAIFEHNPLNPLSRLAVARCEFDVGVELVPPREAARRMKVARLAVGSPDYIVFFPWRGAIARRAETWLRRVPLGAQYCAIGRKR